MLLQALASAASVGLGCGTGCGSSASAFLAAYILSEEKGFLGALRQVVGFLVGKLLAVTVLCAAASLLGGTLIDENGLTFGVDLHALLGWTMLLCSIWLIYRWFRERRGCAGCRHCAEKKPQTMPPFFVGLAYGASPCAPLMMVLGYAALLPVPGAVLLGTVFALCSSLTPALITFTVSGALSKKITAELGRAMPWFRLFVYCFFFAAAIASLMMK